MTELLAYDSVIVKKQCLILLLDEIVSRVNHDR